MARKQQPSDGRYTRTSVPGIYKRRGRYVVRVATGESRKDYPAESFEQAKDIKREKEMIRRTRGNTGVIYTVREWLGDKTLPGRWLELFPRPKEGTMLHNRERVGAFVREHGEKLLTDVTAEMALDFHNAHPSNTIVVRAAFNDAVKARQIDESPFAAVRVKKSRGRKDIVVLTEPELRKLIATAHLIWGDFGREVFAPMIAVAAGTGVRPGENFAITRDDLDLEAGEVHVWRQWNGRTRKFASTKGTRLDRRVAMLDIARQALAGMEFPESGTIWRTVRDVTFKYRELGYYWSPVRDAFTAQLPESHHLQRRLRGEVPGGKLDFYEMRHFYGTALARMDCSVFEIEDQMGHNDSATIRTYLHLANEDVRDSVREKIRRAA